MNAALVLRHFDRLSEAPEAVPDLRGFVLDLAVRGRLVERDPRDEPAAELLDRIAAEKLARDSAAKRVPAEFFQVDETEWPFGLPDGWKWVRLTDVLLKLTDGTHHSPTNVAEGAYMYVTAKNIKPDGVSLDNISYVTADVHDDIFARCNPEKGDILYIKDGATTGVVTINNLDEPFSMLSSVALLKPSSCVDNRLLVAFLRSPFFYGQMRGFMKGAAITRVTLKRMGPALVPLPPLAEQLRIVAKVDELMALCDRLEAAQAERERRRDRMVAASLKRLNEPTTTGGSREHVRFHLQNLPRLTTRREHIKELRQTILNSASRGRLVPQDRGDERPHVVIDAEGRGSLLGGPKQKTRSSTIEVPRGSSELPSGWAWMRVEDLLDVDSQNGCSKKPDDAVDGVPILRISAGTLRRDGLVAEEEHKLIGGLSRDERKHFELRSGDLLACRFNGNRNFLGRVSLYVGYLGIDPIYPDKLIRLRLNAELAVPKLVRHFAESDVVRADIEGYCATTVGNWGISATNLKKVRIPLPPIPEQQRIVAKVDELMAICDKLEAQLSNVETESSRLLEATLHHALAVA